MIHGRFRDDEEYPTSLRVVENIVTGTRYAEVYAPSVSLAMTWDQLPAIFSPFDENFPSAVLRAISPRGKGGGWWLLELTYSSVALSSGGGPGMVPGLLYTEYGQEGGTITLDADIDLNPINPEGASVPVRYSSAIVVHHRTAPLSAQVLLGLVGNDPGRQGTLGLTNDRPVAMPPAYWDQVSFQVPDVVFGIGELLYLGTTQEYIQGGLWIARHSFQAAPDHKHHWVEANPDTGVRTERSAVMLPSANLAVLWQ